MTTGQRYSNAAGQRALSLPDSGRRLGQRLRAAGLGELAAALLGEGSPLPLLGAQALYFAAPVLDPLLGVLGAEAPAARLAAVLDDPAALQALADELTETA